MKGHLKNAKSLDAQYSTTSTGARLLGTQVPHIPSSVFGA